MSIKDDNLDELMPLLPSSSKEQSTTKFSNLIRFVQFFSNLNQFEMAKFGKCYFFGINIITYFTYGLSLAAFGVSLQEYQRNIQILDAETGKYRNMDMVELSKGISLSSIIGCLSALLAIFSLDTINRQLQFGVLLIFYGAVTIIYPLASSYSVYLFNSCLAGFVISYIHAIPSIWTVELFPENPTKYIQILHFFHPLGEFSAPILVASFLNKTIDPNKVKPLAAFFSDLTTIDSIDSRDSTDSINFMSSSQTEVSNSLYDSLFGVAKTSDLWKPYIVISSLKWLAATLTLISYAIKPYQKSINNDLIKSSDEFDILKKAKRKLSRKYVLLFAFIVCIIVGIHWTNEQSSYNYISTYLQTKGIDEKMAAYGQGVLSFSIAIGRFLNIFISMIIKVEYMIFANFILIILGNLMMITISHHSIVASCFCIVLMGLGFSSLYPLFIGFVDERINMNNKMIASMTFSAGFFQTIAPMFIGEYLDNGSSPENYIWLNIVITGFAFALFIFLIILEGFRLKAVEKLKSSKTIVQLAVPILENNNNESNGISKQNSKKF